MNRLMDVYTLIFGICIFFLLILCHINYFVFITVKYLLIFFQGYHSLQSYRIAHALWNKGRKVLALALQSRISEVISAKHLSS